MPGFTIEQLPGEPIILASFQADWDTVRDTDAALAIVNQILSAAQSPMFYIVDVTIEPRFNLDDLMFVSQRITRGQNAIMQHPNLREHMLVTHNPVMQRYSKALPGSVKARAFDTLDEALDYVRSQI